MAKHYVTFGQQHTHLIGGKKLDRDTVAVFEAKSAEEGRTKAFELFGEVFFTDYHSHAWREEDLHFFPKGYVEIKFP